MAPLIVIIVLVVLVVLFLVVAYNGLVKRRNRTQEAWSQIDVELKRRHDLIPNLVETVKGYAAHESGTFEAVTNARAAAVSAGASGNPAAVGQAENVL
ncbi:MAG TPA: LemA family protein, partial [Actinomycetes bacterium]